VLPARVIHAIQWGPRASVCISYEPAGVLIGRSRYQISGHFHAKS
jgi:hypothetical protein